MESLETSRTTGGERAPVRVGVVGLGRLGARHARMLAQRVEDVELTIVADADEERARAVAAELHLPRWTADYHAVVEDPHVDAVVIVSPTDTHAEIISAAAAQGKAILCEKPISLDLEATERALADVAAAGVPLQIGFQRRFDPGYRRAREIYARGELGRLYMIKSTLRDPQLPPLDYLARSGGIFRDAIIHDIDALRYLSGEEIVEVFAMGAALVDPAVADLGDADTVVLSVRFSSGALGVVDASRHAVYGHDVKTEVFGSQGAVLVEQVRDIPITRFDATGVSHDHIYWFLERFDAAYLAELRAFIACVRDGVTPEVGGEDGRRALIVALAAARSRADNRPVGVNYT